MLVMAASTFFKTGLTEVGSLEGAHKTLEPILGGASSVLFALALIASGLSSSAVGTLSGQVVMQGFIRRQIPVTVRRLVTMMPAFVVIAIGLDPSRTLVISQVVLSFGIPFALIPLVYFTARRDIMGGLVNRTRSRRSPLSNRRRRLIVALNMFLLAQTFGVVALQVADRVDGRAVDPDLEVQVRPGRVAGRADVADHLALARRAGRSVTAIELWCPYAVARLPPWSITTRFP